MQKRSTGQVITEAKRFGDPLHSHLLLEQRIIVLTIGNQRDVHKIALVASASVGDLSKFHEATSMPIVGRTRSRGRKVASIAMFSRIEVTTPPPPAGPLT